jgi:outer membrane lipoprotein SlyB
VGNDDGAGVGLILGSLDGAWVGSCVGTGVGAFVGSLLGVIEGGSVRQASSVHWASRNAVTSLDRLNALNASE